MQFSKIALGLALAFTAAALDDPVDPFLPHLSLEEQCTYGGNVLSFWQYNVVISDASDFTDDECGSGFLDNLHGRGCAVTRWGCNYADDGSTMNANFATDSPCYTDDVSAAINAAFGGKSVGCEYVPN
ncbi:hypothetical protein FQN54_002410 [Arachnomyces sp. PD_36]|nr:hypothetical protein FQN54_002410 [Arachnomyces sp. PD_36]